MLYVAVVAVLAFVVLGTAWWKLHPFLVLVTAAAALALGAGLPVAVGVEAMLGGFGKTVGAIGIVIAAGAIIGVALEESGGAEALAQGMLRVLGERHALLAIGVTGAVVSIPVFCDSGFILLAPVAFRVAAKAGHGRSTAAVMLGMGLYLTHTLVPPTPGPVAAAGALGVDVSRMVLFGALVTVPGLLVLRVLAPWIGAWSDRAADAASGEAGASSAVEGPSGDVAKARAATGEVAASVSGKRVGALAAAVPIVLPVVLMGTRSMAGPAAGEGGGAPVAVLTFAGEPSVALLLGAAAAFGICAGADRGRWMAWTEKALRGAGPIVLVTAAGGALGGVLRATPLSATLAASLEGVALGPFALLVPFFTSALLKTLLGSSTVAMATAAPVMLTMLEGLGLAAGDGPLLAALAVAAGAMAVSHANDSYFWVVREFSRMGVSQTYRAHSLTSLLLATTTLLTLLLLGTGSTPPNR